MFLNIRKERKHHCGHSNLDFRSYKSESLTKFVNSKNKSDFNSRAKDSNMDNSENNNFFKSTNIKKSILKLPFNDPIRINKLSEEIDKNQLIKNSLEKILEPKLTQDRKFFKIISPLHIKFTQNFTNINKKNIEEEQKNNQYNVDSYNKEDKPMEDFRQSYKIENEFNKNNSTFEDTKKAQNTKKNSLNSAENHIKSI